MDAYFQLMHDLLVDDSELIGDLIREGRLIPAVPSRSSRRHPLAESSPPPV